MKHLRIAIRKKKKNNNINKTTINDTIFPNEMIFGSEMKRKKN